MNVLILGAGAVGLSLAAKLSSVCNVHAVCRERHAEKIRSEGFRMTGIWGESTYSFSCSENVPKGLDFDYIFIASKSTATESICEQFKDIIKDCEVISMQNGLGNEEIIAKYTDNVIGGTIITGFEWKDDAEINVSVQSGPMNLGRFPSGLDESVMELAELVKEASIPVQTTENIKTSIWSKVLYNSALNPLGAVMGVPYGKLSNSHAWSIVSNIVEEAFLILEAENVPLPWAKAEEYLAYLYDVQIPNTANHHSSMLQDISSGRKTEIDFLNGAIVRMAKELDVKAPYNSFISEQIRFMEDLQAK